MESAITTKKRWRESQRSSVLEPRKRNLRSGSLNLPALTGLVAAAVLANGCTTLGPDFAAPEAPVAKEFYTASESNEESKEQPDAATKFSDWWTIFNDPILDALIQQAYQQNLTLRTAGLRILEARAQLGIARGSQYPQLQQGRGGLTRNHISENSPNFNRRVADDKFWDANVGFDAGWELDFWGRFRRAVESADANLIASVANYDDLLVTLTGDVASTYVTIRTLQELLRIAADNIKVQARSLRIADIRFQNGAVTELDVQQARTLLRNTEADVPRLQAQLRQAQNALSTLLGQPTKNLDEMLGVQPIPAAPSAVAVGIPADLLRRRPDVRRAELRAATQSPLVGFAQTDLYPRFALLGSLGLSAADTGSNDLSDLFEKRSFEVVGGPQFTWNIFNYGRLKNNVRVQDARLQQLLVDYQNTVLRAAQEVEDGLVEFLRAQDSARFLSGSARAARRSVQLALIQYRDGAVDFQRVLDTQRALLDSQQRLASSQGDIATGLVATYKALGGGWELRLGKDFVPESTREQMAERTDWGDLLTPVAPPEPLEPPPPAREQPLFPTLDW